MSADRETFSRLVNLQRRVRMTPSKKEAVDLLRNETGVTRSWAERHVKALGTADPHEFVKGILSAAPIWRSQ